MMKFLKFFLTGILFGIILTKSEVVSWFRIQEMFRFESFHMYGVIGTAVVVGALIIIAIKRTHLKNMYGGDIIFPDKKSYRYQYLFGGTIFGLGWAMTGACPGPLFVLAGHGVWVILIAIASAILGTFTYGAIRDFLPH